MMDENYLSGAESAPYRFAVPHMPQTHRSSFYRIYAGFREYRDLPVKEQIARVLYHRSAMTAAHNDGAEVVVDPQRVLQVLPAAAGKVLSGYTPNALSVIFDPWEGPQLTKSRQRKLWHIMYGIQDQGDREYSDLKNSWQTYPRWEPKNTNMSALTMSEDIKKEGDWLIPKIVFPYDAKVDHSRIPVYFVPNESRENAKRRMRLAVRLMANIDARGAAIDSEKLLQADCYRWPRPATE